MASQMLAPLVLVGLGLGLFFVVRGMKKGKPTASSSSAEGRKTFLVPTERKEVQLVAKHEISHDTRRFRFGLPAGTVLGLPEGKHIFISASVDGKAVSRPYTPTSLDTDGTGYFDLVVKVYRAGANPRFPSGGVMSQYLDALPIGGTVSVRGPFGSIEYAGGVTYLIRPPGAPAPAPVRYSRVGMVAGGTGITPMYQVIRAIERDAGGGGGAVPELWLLYCNQTEDDILLRGELDALHASGRVRVRYSLDRPPAGWGQCTGFVTEEMCRAHLPPASAETAIFLCGPKPMVELACIPNLTKCGHDAARIHTF